MKGITKCLIVALIGIMLFVNAGLVFGADQVKHAGASLSYKNTAVLDSDIITNNPVAMNHALFLMINNPPDGQGSLFNPKIELTTQENLQQFGPNDPAIFSANPPTYTWNFAGLEVKEGAIVPINAQAQDSTIITKPHFSLSRTVQPEILTAPSTLQTVTIQFKLEEPLPAPIDQLNIYVGSPVIAYQGTPLVQGTFVSQNDVVGWSSNGQGTSASWYIPVSNVEIGKTYTFQATLQSTKSAQLQGSPVFKPDVLVQYKHVGSGEQTAPQTSTTITMPDNSMSATFSVSTPVQWSSIYFDAYYDFLLSSKVSQITPPPFHVLVPATVRIEPQTLNLNSKGVITAFVNLPAPYSINDVDASTVNCQGAVASKAKLAGDTLVLKFDRQALQGLTPNQEVTLMVTGELVDGSIFSGQATIRTN